MAAVQSETAEASAPAVRRRARILVVDDESINTLILRQLLQSAYDVSVAADAQAALARIGEEGRPDLILLDVVMPGMDGFELCRRLKSAPATADIPVIFVTAQTEAAFETQGFELGAVDYISKPFHPAVVTARVRTHLDRQRKLALLETLAFVDGLTELPNRRQFDERLKAAWRGAVRDSTHLSLLVLDLDHFKSVNDTHGHAAGDECLMHVARCLAAEARRPDDLAGRLGGEEFGILLPRTDAEGAATIAEHVRAAVARLDIPLPFAKASFKVTASLGCGTVAPVIGIGGPETFVDAVDALLYDAKRGGRNRVVAASL